MFKSVEYRLIAFSALLAVSAAATTWLLVEGRVLWALVALYFVVWSSWMMSRSYKKFNSNVIFLLNSLENGDYSFHFSETKMSRREKELNSVLNVVRAILVKAREEEIASEKFLDLIVRAIPVGIVIIDERDVVRVANDAALRFLGMHVFTHLKQLGMVDEELLEVFRSLSPGRPATVRIADEREEKLISLEMSEIRFKKGSLRVIALHDIADEIEAGEMESWIKLIRVMTHEIMNSIAPITSLSETMLAAYGGETVATVGGNGESGDRLRQNTIEAFGTITSTARGLLSFVESYRRFTGIPKPEPGEVKLAPFVGRMIALESPAFRRRGIEMTVTVEDPEQTVRADEGQLAQVLVNLLKNAVEAIPTSQRDGRIDVNVHKSGEQLWLDVSNNGIPVPEDVLPHIFIPFFTTKETGIGIGLSVSRYIMRLHGGNLKHRFEGGRTTFSMIFPALKRQSLA